MCWTIRGTKSQLCKTNSPLWQHVATTHPTCQWESPGSSSSRHISCFFSVCPFSWVTRVLYLERYLSTSIMGYAPLYSSSYLWRLLRIPPILANPGHCIIYNLTSTSREITNPLTSPIFGLRNTRFDIKRISRGGSTNSSSARWRFDLSPSGCQMYAGSLHLQPPQKEYVDRRCGKTYQ